MNGGRKKWKEGRKQVGDKMIKLINE